MSAILPLYHQTMAWMSREYPVVGLALNHHPNFRGLPLSFRQRPYLVELYTELPKCEGADIVKAVQTGVTELLFQVAFEAAGWRGRIVAYVLPTYTIRNRIVQTRVDPLLMNVPAYRVRTPAALRKESAGKNTRTQADNLNVKRFGAGAILFLGAGTSTDFVEFSADMMIVDEYDEAVKEGRNNLAMARDRLREAVDPRSIHLGNPDLPRRGISRLYAEGDQRRFHFRCGHCREWQPIDWLDNVVVQEDGGWVPRDIRAWRAGDEIRPVCRKCSQPFEREAEGAAWIPTRIERGLRRSYHMQRLEILSDSLRKLFVDEWLPAQGDSVRVRAFHRGVRGIAWEPTGGMITQDMLLNACTGADIERSGLQFLDDAGKPLARSKIPTVTMGVDVGSLLHVSISTSGEREGEPVRIARFVGTVVRFEELLQMVKDYQVEVVTIDMFPETRKAQEFRDACQAIGVQCWLSRFHPTDRVGVQKYGMKVDYTTSVVQVDRTQIMDVTYDDILTGARVFPRDAPDVLGWSDQMRASVRILTTEGTQRFVWQEEAVRPDHFRFADLYDRLAFDIANLGGRYFGGAA